MERGAQSEQEESREGGMEIVVGVGGGREVLQSLGLWYQGIVPRFLPPWTPVGPPGALSGVQV